MTEISETILDAAQAELASDMVPWPDDYVETLTPPAALLLGRQMAMVVAKVCTAAMVSLEENEDEPAGVEAEVLNGLAAAVAGFTHAMVALEILPPEAEEALEAGQ